MSKDVMTLADFLLARISEDEDDATLARDDLPTDEWTLSDYGSVYAGEEFDKDGLSYGKNDIVQQALADTGRHIARHDPARVLAECGAKRRIVENAEGRESGGHVSWPGVWLLVLRLLALPYADHPDYDESWRP